MRFELQGWCIFYISELTVKSNVYFEKGQHGLCLELALSVNIHLFSLLHKLLLLLDYLLY